jgi:hypothetical protein
MFHGLGPLACFNSEPSCEIINPCKHFGGTPWIGEWSTSRPLPTQDSTTKETWMYIHALSWIQIHDPTVGAVQDHMHLSSATGAGYLTLIKEEKMSRTYSMHGVDEKYIHHFS